MIANLRFPSIAEGQVFSWGKGGRGRLGRTEEDAQTPGLVVCKHDEPYIVVSLSSSHGNTLLASKRKSYRRSQMMINLCLKIT